MKNIKVKAKFSVSDEFYKSDTFQELKKSILQNEIAKELELEGDIFDMNISFSVIEK